MIAFDFFTVSRDIQSYGLTTFIHMHVAKTGLPTEDIVLTHGIINPVSIVWDFKTGEVYTVRRMGF